MSRWGQLGFEDASNFIMQDLIEYHDLSMFLILVVSSGVTVFLLFTMVNGFSWRTLPNSERLETAWTVTPVSGLLMLAVPSLQNLYVQDEVVNPELTLKVIGHQWYWSYEYPVEGEEMGNYTFDSYMIKEGLSKGQVRFYDVDKRAVLPVDKTIRVLVTSADVLHSWTLLGAGVKVDGVPGRVNQTQLHFLRPGVFYGQCSELCGVYHSYMPIVVEAIPESAFNSWVQA
uniref:Cytochrome c oxidase subunit 2 n=1 Tax=Laternula truncata TaxID=1199070 RepID=A0A1U9XPL1_9BIVA|nr:cytochrome c oxidase subunit II [Laternula truncata]AQZ26191.1 cytochrome c oxidase subunit II [Laternula truncata]